MTAPFLKLSENHHHLLHPFGSSAKVLFDYYARMSGIIDVVFDFRTVIPVCHARNAARPPGLALAWDVSKYHCLQKKQLVAEHCAEIEDLSDPEGFAFAISIPPAFEIELAARSKLYTRHTDQSLRTFPSPIR